MQAAARSRPGTGQRPGRSGAELLKSLTAPASWRNHGSHAGRTGIQLVRSDESVPPIECAPRELEQVFLNLLLNAADAVGDSGTIRLSTFCDAARARVEVADDGSGIAPADLARVFDPFFTTKPVGKGTGLGLAISYEIVQRHGGEIEVRSELGRGTVFSVWLPLAPST